MNNIQLLEQIKECTVEQFCNAVIDVADNYCSKYYPKNDTQGTSSVIGVAIDLRNNHPELKGLKLEELVPEGGFKVRDNDSRLYILGEVLWLAEQILIGRQLKEPKAIIPYTTVEEFVSTINNN